MCACSSALLVGSRDALREAFSTGPIDDGPAWMAMVNDCNLTSHVYNRSTAEAIVANISGSCLASFRALRTRLEELAEAEEA